jgi:hypothetical protein
MVRTIFAAALLVRATCASSPEAVQGEVALTDSPFCEFFVVKTEHGFSLLDWRGGLYVIAEGDRVRGPLTTTGLHAFVFAGSSNMRAEVEEADVDFTRARLAYYARCHPTKPDPSLPAGTVAAAQPET